MFSNLPAREIGMDDEGRDKVARHHLTRAKTVFLLLHYSMGEKHRCCIPEGLLTKLTLMCAKLHWT